MIETLLEVRNLSKTFRYRTGWFRRQTVEAVKPLSFTLREGQTLAIIGEAARFSSWAAPSIPLESVCKISFPYITMYINSLLSF